MPMYFSVGSHGGQDYPRPLEALKKRARKRCVGKLKHAPPLQANDLPSLAQAVSPANRILSQLLRETVASSLHRGFATETK